MHSSLPGLFALLISVQCVVIVAHDLVDIPGWSHGSQVRAVIGPRKFWIGTLINAVFPCLAFVYAVQFWGAPIPTYVANYWAVYCGVTMFSALMMWWLPYFFGAKEETKRMYAAMYAGTRHVLPSRGDNPRPNLLHLFFHLLFLLNLGLALRLWFGSR